MKLVRGSVLSFYGLDGLPDGVLQTFHSRAKNELRLAVALLLVIELHGAERCRVVDFGGRFEFAVGRYRRFKQLGLRQRNVRSRWRGGAGIASLTRMVVRWARIRHGRVCVQGLRDRFGGRYSRPPEVRSARRAFRDQSRIDWGQRYTRPWPLRYAPHDGNDAVDLQPGSHVGGALNKAGALANRSDLLAGPSTVGCRHRRCRDNDEHADGAE
jgi:hypothetical protein